MSALTHANLTRTFSSAASSPAASVVNERLFTESNKRASQKRLFKSMSKAPLSKSFTLKQLKSRVDLIKDFTARRLNRTRKESTIKRLTQRQKDLDAICNHFSNTKDQEFMGFIGWGPGCLNTGLQSNNDISSVDGFYYKDTKSGDVHYQRIGSCLELFLSPVQTSPADDDIVTDGGLDINLNKQTVTNSPSEKSKKISEYYPPEISNELKHLNTSVLNFTRQIFSNLDPKPVIVNVPVTTKASVSMIKVNATLPSIATLSIDRPKFSIYTVTHGDHKHFHLVRNKKTGQIWLPMMGIDKEGCPCCNLGVDLDELAAGINELLNSSSTAGDTFNGVTTVANAPGLSSMPTDAVPNVEATTGSADTGSLEVDLHAGELDSLQSLAHFDSVAYQAAVPFMAIFATLGISASYMNIKGCAENLVELNKVIKHLDAHIQRAKDAKDELVLENLLAYKKSLNYSKFDAGFNIAVPGILNGAASTFVAATLVWHNPFALPFIGAYSIAQVGRNIYDLARTWNQNINKTQLKELLKTTKADHIKKCMEAGRKKINQTCKTKRTFYSGNSAGFLAFATGAILTFLSLPALALGIGAPALIAGLTLLGIGAASTCVTNNIWTKKFKPRNGELGIDRRTATKESLIAAIGDRAQKKRIIKTFRKLIPLNKVKRTFISLFSSLPGAAPKAQKMKHADNLRAYKAAAPNLKITRSVVLKKLLAVQGDKFEVGDSIENQWKACQKLGMATDILNVLEKDFYPDLSHHHHHHSHDHKHHSHGHEHHPHDHEHHPHGHEHHPHGHKHKKGDCCGSHAHTKDEFELKLVNTGLFEASEKVLKDEKGNITKDKDGKTIKLKGGLKLKDLKDCPETSKDALGKAIDFYLYFEYLKKMQYQQYAINDFYWNKVETEKEMAKQKVSNS